MDALAVFAKEWRSLLRDRNTLVYAVALPLFVYPILFLGLAQWLQFRRGVEERTDARVVLAGASLPAGLERALRGRDGLEVSGPVPPAPVADAADPSALRLEASLREDLAAERIDAVLLAPPGGSPRLLYDSARDRSVLARRRVEEALVRAREDARRDAARRSGNDPRDLEVVSVAEEDAASPIEGGRRLLSLLLPALLILMTVSGAFIPAIDLTAGEKERRTAETTLLLPISRRAVLAGKFLAVVAAGGLSCALNLASMLLASRAFLAGAEGSLVVRLPVGSVLLVLGVAILFLVFAASLLLSVALLARSFREAQSYLTPLFTVFVVAPLLVVQPGVRLTYGRAWIPVANATLALRDALAGEISPGPFLAATAALAIGSVAGLLLAARLHARADLHLSQESIPLARLPRLLRREAP